MSIDFSCCKLKFEEQISNDQKISLINDFVNNESIKKSKLIKEKRIKLRPGRAVWIEERRLAKVIVFKNISNLMGFCSANQRYLYPEEAMFLLESSSIEVMHNDIPVSIQEGYSLFFMNKSEFNVYRVYSYLSREGYFVKRHKQVNSECQSNSQKRNEYSSQERSFKLLKTDHHKYDFENNEIDHFKVNQIKPFSMSLLRNCDEKKEIVFKKILAKDKAKSWKKYKNLIEGIDNTEMKTQLYNIESCLCKDKESINNNHFESNNILWSGKVKPIYHPKNIFNSNEFFNLLKLNGPKEVMNFGDAKSFKIDLEVFNSKSKLDSTHFLIVVLESNSKIEHCFYSNMKNVYFAVIDDEVINFYTFRNFHLNDEIPILWETNCRDTKVSKN